MPTGLVAAGGAVLLATTLAGAAIGAWSAALVGVSVPSGEVQRYEEAVERGELLMLVDVPRSRAREFCRIIRRHHPEAEIKETEYIPPPLPEIPDE